jgi:hypothetical protein
MSKSDTAATRRKMQRKVPGELGPICGLIAIAAIPAAVIPAAAQQESYDWRYLTVAQRPRDQFDAKGIPVGSSFRLLPSFDVKEEYSDNLYATGSPTATDFQTTFSPKLQLESDWSRHSLSFTAYGDIHRYTDKTTENNDEYGADGALGLQLGQGGSFGLSGGYAHETVSRGDPENSNRLEPEQVDVTNGKAEWKQVFSFLLLGATAQITNYRETSSLDRDKDRTEMLGAVRVGYVFSPALNVFVEPSYTKRDFDLAVDFGGVNRDSEVMAVNAGIGYDITGVLFGETKVGWYRAGFSDPRTKANSGLSVESKTTWNPTARDTVIFTLARQNVITNALDTSSRVLTGGAIEYQHELLRNILLRASFSYFDDDFVGSFNNRDDEEIKGSFRADYFLNHYLSFYAMYSRNTVNSTVDTETFDENVFMIGIHTQL